MDHELFLYLLDTIHFFEEDDMKQMEFHEIIQEKEIGLSQITLNNNWNINSIMKEYRGLDYRILQEDINPTSTNGDPYHSGAYFGNDVDPYDAIFFKISRLSSPSI
jgi:hypothetical protein